MTVYMPLWGVILIGVAVVAVIGLLIATIKGSQDRAADNALSTEYWRREYDLIKKQDQTAIAKVIEEETTKHSGKNELINVLRSGYETHYGKFRQNIVERFMEKSDSLLESLSGDLSDQLMKSIQPIFNDMGGEGSFILPNGVKHAYQKGKSIVILLENQAGLRSSTFTRNSLKGSEELTGTPTKVDSTLRNRSLDCFRFNLSFPYTYFLFTFRLNSNDKPTFSKFSIYFRNSPLTSMKQSLYPAPLLNLGTNNAGLDYVCMGDSIAAETEHKSVAQMCEELIAEWWSRAFHNDLNEADFRNGPLGNILKWQRKSEKDPFWACTIKWKHGKKARAILDEALIHEGESLPARDCKTHVEDAAYTMTKQLGITLRELKPETELSADAFEPAAVKSFENSVNQVTNKVISRII
jgi:gas vesicle protein